MHLHNKCYRWQLPNQVDKQIRLCHSSRGNLLEVSPADPISEMIAKAMMTLYNSDVLHAGTSLGKKFKNIFLGYLGIMSVYLKPYIDLFNNRVAGVMVKEHFMARGSQINSNISIHSRL